KVLTNNPELKLNLDMSYAREMNISFNSNCEGEWVPFSNSIATKWLGGDGEVDIYVKFRNFRKQETPCYSSKVLLDATPPALEFTTKVNEITKEANASFDLDIKEATSGIEELKCRFGSEKDLNNPEMDEKVPFEKCDKSLQFADLPDDTYMLEVQAQDVAGNISPPLKYKWIVDSKVPKLVMRARPNKYTNKTDMVRVEFDSDGEENDGSGLKSYECSVNGAEFSVCSSPFELKNVKDGNFKVKIRATDKAKNVSESNVEFTVDTAEPNVKMVRTPAALSNKRLAQLDFIADPKGGAPLKGVFCSIDGGPEKPCANQSTQSYNNLGDGTHTVTVIAEDEAGNRSKIAQSQFKVDATPPQIQMATDKLPDRFTRTNYAKYFYALSDPNNGSGVKNVTCQIDNQPEKTNCNPKNMNFWSLPDGDHTFKLTVTDKAGNAKSFTHKWTVDRKPPTITINSRPSDSKYAKFSYKIDEEGSGIESVECGFDDEKPRACGWGSAARWLNGKKTHYFKMYVTDKAGNQRTYKTSWWQRVQ
ncbi:MAG: Ig-like domain repeat protein, partial [Bdellovibrionales bacterium]|nr:Ig-like domain repeat protein [Bdellovibrionales bacterium]